MSASGPPASSMNLVRISGPIAPPPTTTTAPAGGPTFGAVEEDRVALGAQAAALARSAAALASARTRVIYDIIMRKCWVRLSNAKGGSFAAHTHRVMRCKG